MSLADFLTYSILIGGVISLVMIIWSYAKGLRGAPRELWILFITKVIEYTAYGAISSSEFTLLGDAVNLAFRIEALTRDLEKEILVSGDFLKGWAHGLGYCKSCGIKSVKGRAEGVEVYSVENFPD